eukprot:CAMPEP_0116895326 /NCGR_PEP_ID=MMETSP0467-20121206/4874_1 /TAXON_ID=283647 /ORGANISM="Mesodinium pulex, Strain SPMC105" /LENGTH=47 /DNA_ID= /DNA_START= /DNA_END= /DNA_ORIENTATION=
MEMSEINLDKGSKAVEVHMIKEREEQQKIKNDETKNVINEIEQERNV